ncbi:hypothetical protein CDG77_01935 [Nostoc sp. 'Peltigera membranacea cyanobiont' 213]|nr:hypothetical protein CDG77_01935 [Nostoc sp. 'Peltigera membranacea cyanobiont' 213]
MCPWETRPHDLLPYGSFHKSNRIPNSHNSYLIFSAFPEDYFRVMAYINKLKFNKAINKFRGDLIITSTIFHQDIMPINSKKWIDELMNYAPG